MGVMVLGGPLRLAELGAEGMGTPPWESVVHQGGAPQNTWSPCGAEGQTIDSISYKETLKMWILEISIFFCKHFF